MGRQMEFWGRGTNWLDKSDTNILLTLQEN